MHMRSFTAVTYSTACCATCYHRGPSKLPDGELGADAAPNLPVEPQHNNIPACPSRVTVGTLAAPASQPARLSQPARPATERGQKAQIGCCPFRLFCFKVLLTSPSQVCLARAPSLSPKPARVLPLFVIVHSFPVPGKFTVQYSNLLLVYFILFLVLGLPALASLHLLTFSPACPCRT